MVKFLKGSAAERASSAKTGEAGDLVIEEDTGNIAVADGSTLLGALKRLARTDEVTAAQAAAATDATTKANAVQTAAATDATTKANAAQAAAATDATTKTAAARTGAVADVVAGISNPASSVGSALTTSIDDKVTDDLADSTSDIYAGAAGVAAANAVRSSLLAPKILGGNITVKPGYGWLHLWSEWDWDYWIKPQVDRAIALGLNAVRLIGAPQAPLVAPTFTAWSQGATFPTPDLIRTANGHLYRLVTGGVTAVSGTGPSGTGAAITDGTCVWTYVGEPLTQITQGTYDSRWAQLAEYCTRRGLSLYPSLCDTSAFDAVAVGSYTNATVVSGVCATATVLAKYACVIGFDVFQEGDSLAGYAWGTSKGYSLGARIYSNGKGYIATTAGTSASSGAGPSGTGTGITDGTVVWDYTRVPLLPSDVLSVYASVRAAVGRVPLTTSIGTGSTGFAFDDRDSWVTVLATSAGGPDFIDFHLYTSTVLPRDIDYLVFRTGKSVLIGEFGANQSQTTTVQDAQYNAVLPIHQRDGVRGSFVWALADQGADSSARLAGVWDNTGYVRGTAPLSTTSGKRAHLATIITDSFSKATPGKQYEPPNLLTPERARPVLGPSTLPGASVGYWGANGSNTTRVADPRGIGFKCIAGGTVTRALVGAQSVEPVVVTPGLAYELEVSLLAVAGGRSGIRVYVDWFDASYNQLATSEIITGSDGPASPTTAVLVVVAPATAHFAQPTVEWPATQVTDEVHLIRASYFGLPRDRANTFTPLLDPFMADRLDVGQETMHRMFANTSASLLTGSMRLAFFTARKWDLVTKIRTITATAAAATPTKCRVGLYTVATNGDITLVASSANDTSLWSGATTTYETSLSVPYSTVAGNRYAVGMLCVTAGTAPTVYCTNGPPSAELATAPRLNAVVSSLTDLPSSVVAASLGNSGVRPYAVLLP